MTAVYWYIVRLERQAASWLFRHYGKKIPGKVSSFFIFQQNMTFRKENCMRFHSAATGD